MKRIRILSSEEKNPRNKSPQVSTELALFCIANVLFLKRKDSNWILIFQKGEAGEEASSTTTEAQQYVDHNSYIIIDINLDRAMIEKRKLTDLFRK